MRTLLMLARKSLWSRRGTVLLTVLSVATSFALLVSVERLRETTRSSFESTMSGTDLLVGARGSGVQLLLYSVFRLGEPVREMSWQSYEALADHPEVAWSVPIALGDSVRGYRVVGTSPDYFRHYRYGRDKALSFRSGVAFRDHNEAVLGSEVARELGWSLQTRFPIQHGVTDDAHAHEHTKFRVVGILAPTGTPLDRSVHITLEGMAAAHQDPTEHDDDAHETHEHEHEEAQLSTVSAAFIGLRSKIGLFRMRSWVDGYSAEPLMAVMPARAFQQLWSTVSVAETTLQIIGILVTLAGIIALSAMLLATVNERRREMALLRSVGASPIHVAALIVGEALLVALASVVVALCGVFGVEMLGQRALADAFGLQITPTPVAWIDLRWAAAFMVVAVIVALIPAAISYRRSISDGLLVRL